MRAWKWLLPGLAVLLVGGCIAVPVGNHLLYSRRSFAADRWRAGDVRQRARMVADLRWSGVLVGKSREEVSALLGPPDREGEAAWEYDYVHGDLLGDALDLPFSGWREWVRVEFDEATGRAREVELRD